MKKKFQTKTIEDIALQFIKHIEIPSPPKKYNNNDTIMDTKFYIKKYTNKKKSDKSLSNSYSKLIPYGDKLYRGEKNNLKIIKFFKIPQKILGEDEEFLFEYETKEKNQNEINNKNISKNVNKLKNDNKYKLREINALKYNIKTKIFFNINYRNAYDCITELYIPLMQNLESISSFKSNKERTISCIEFFCSHNSIFELLDSKDDKNNNNNDIILELMEHLKIFEIVLCSLILFILHIIQEAKIEYIDNFDEEDIVYIYKDSLKVLEKLYEIIILILQLNEKNNNINNINKNNTSKFIIEFYEKEAKINNEEEMVNKINENVSCCLSALFKSCKVLFGNLILFKKESGNLDMPEECEKNFLSIPNTNLKNENPKDKIYLSKEFTDQYLCFKTIYLFFTQNKLNNNKNITNKEKDKQEVEKYDFLSMSESSTILSKLTTVFSSCKEMFNNLLLYYTNFKILLEKNKVKPPFLGPVSDPKKNFTLVVDLDETLVHYVEEENRAYVQVRPYADYFLSEMEKYFEIVIFTAAAEDYADIVLNELDKNNSIDYKLYRKHTEQINGVFIKNLSKLGRDINKVVIIDNNKDNFSLQPENGLHISSFMGDQNDDELLLLTTDLMKIIKGNQKDVRPAVKEIDKIMKKRYKMKNIPLE